jgi:hypothetical protein
VGDEFRRLGTRFKGWGFQTQGFDFLHDFFASTDMTDSLHTTMKNVFSGDHANHETVYRLRLMTWEMLDVNSPNENSLSINATAMANLIFLLDAARENNIYVLLGGIAQQQITSAYLPAWYDDSFGSAVPKDRWDVQEFFWTEVAKKVVSSGNSSTIIGYELASEPVVASDPAKPWYGEAYQGSDNYFAMVVARGTTQTGATAMATAVAWMTQLRDAIKVIDPKALVTVGALPFGANTQPFGVANSEPVLDFLAPHHYPNSVGFGNNNFDSLALLNQWSTATKPILVGEIIPWGNQVDNDAFFASVDLIITGGLISFSYGYGPDAFPPADYFPKIFPAPIDADGIGGASWAASLLSEIFQTGFESYRVSFMSAP